MNNTIIHGIYNYYNRSDRGSEQYDITFRAKRMFFPPPYFRERRGLFSTSGEFKKLFLAEHF